MKLFPLLKIYSNNSKKIEENFQIGELFDLINTEKKIMTLDHEEIIKALEVICTDYKRKGSRLKKIQKAHSVLARACTYKLAGKNSLIHSCMELLCPEMNKVVKTALNKYFMAKQKYANRRIIIYKYANSQTFQYNPNNHINKNI